MKLYTITKHIGVAALLLLILLVGGWIRLQGLPTLPTGQFASNDAYLYYSHAETLIEHGTLPKTEMHRWVPLGRDLTEMLHGYAYVLAASYKVISLFFPNVTLYQIQRVAPTICFLIGIAVLCCFLYVHFGLSVAIVVGILLAVMPGSIERSSAGFSDRDSWCWLLGILVVIPYFYKERTQLRKRTRYLCTALSGGFVFLGGLSWEGFGGFVLAIVAVELWGFLTTDTEEHLSEYVLWVLMFVPWLYLFCPLITAEEAFQAMSRRSYCFHRLSCLSSGRSDIHSRGIPVLQYFFRSKSRHVPSRSCFVLYASLSVSLTLPSSAKPSRKASSPLAVHLS